MSTLQDQPLDELFRKCFRLGIDVKIWTNFFFRDKNETCIFTDLASSQSKNTKKKKFRLSYWVALALSHRKNVSIFFSHFRSQLYKKHIRPTLVTDPMGNRRKRNTERATDMKSEELFAKSLSLSLSIYLSLTYSLTRTLSQTRS
jgi:hypothetical protein